MPNPLDALRNLAPKAPPPTGTPSSLDMLTGRGMSGGEQDAGPGWMDSLSHLLGPLAHPSSWGDMAQLLLPSTGAKGLMSHLLPGEANVAPGASSNALGALRKAAPVGMGTSPMGAGDLLNPQTAEVMDRMYQGARPAAQAAQATGMMAGDRSVGGLHSLASRAASTPVQETLGEMASDFTPVGGEGMYNAGRNAASKRVVDPIEAAYQRLKGGR